ncbi:MAG TPA: hypothetical protein DEH22_01630 [Chloroflexi bacterium]|nr:hypothetical protein [Chloroflexota bacterium]
MKYFRGNIARQVIFTYASLALFVFGVAMASIIVVEYVRQAAIVQARQHQDKALLSARIRSEALALTNDIQLYVVAPGSETSETDAIDAQLARLEELLQLAFASVDSNNVDESFALGDIRQYLIAFNVQARYVLNTYDAEGSYGPETQKQMAILVNNYQPALFDSLEKFAEFESAITDASFYQAEQSIIKIRIGLVLLAGVTLISTIIMVWQVVKRFVLPLITLTEGVKQMQAGILNIPIAITTQDEMGELAQALNKMASEVSASREQLEQYAATLEAQVEERTIELKRLATIDPLTGILNRRQYIYLSELLIAEAERYDTPISVIMFDIDHFKKVNDTYGHAKGDEVLKHISQIVLGQIREADIFGRYGGEEFTLTLPQTPLKKAIQMTQRISIGIQQILISEDDSVLQVTASFGITARGSSNHETLDQLLKNADDALYDAKRNGRNQICTYSRQREKTE